MNSSSKYLTGLLFLLVAGCGGSGGSGSRGNSALPPPAAAAVVPAAHSQCSLASARREVLEIFENYYFFNQFPQQAAKYADVRARLASFSSVDDLLDELRYRPGSHDRGFSYYATTEEVDQFFSAGEFYGFGFNVGVGAGGAWRLLDVFGNSPADIAGLVRGDTILSIDGNATAGLNLNSESTFGPAATGVVRTLEIRHADGSEETVTLTKATVDLDPVPQNRVRVFEVAGRLVGYLFFRTFVEDADDLLRDAMGSLADQALLLGGTGIDDLVVDLRYNGGGLVSTAEVLGSLLAGNTRAGSIFFEYEYNDWVEDQYGNDADDIRAFHDEAAALSGLENVFYLTDAGTASASELLISGLAPYMTSSVTIGARTYGKPVGQWGLEYCNDSMVLFIVTFRTVNVNGEADYYTGMPASCAADDDWDHLLGDPSEGRLDAALDYIESNGAICTAPVMRLAAQSLSGAPVLDVPQAIAGASLASKLIQAY